MHIQLQTILLLLIFALFFKMCECQDMSMDVRTPRNVYLSGFYKRSFAYHTVKNRMPIILTQLIDNLARNKDEILKEYGEAASEGLKKAIGEIAKLKYEIQTNKPLINLTSEEPDVHYYNEYIVKQATEDGHTTHFNTIWLLTECYMYRRIQEIFVLTDSLKNYDYFQKSKQEAYEKALPLMSQMGMYLLEVVDNIPTSIKESFISILKLNLWGNKCDLSISLGKISGPSKLFDTKELEPFVLANQSDKIWDAVSDTQASSDIIDIVLDNSGYEVFTDCCLADFLITHNLAKFIRIYVKSIPWFISDVMEHDFHWMIDQLKQSAEPSLNQLGQRWEEYISNGTWTLVVDSFWTLPFEFKFMKEVKPDLYRKLSEAKIIIFKGDLNYRKLFGEINWDPTTSVEEALQGFYPSKLCVLRTIKADIVVGLKAGIAEAMEKKDPTWMEHGDFGLIQFCEKVVKIN